MKKPVKKAAESALLPLIDNLIKEIEEPGEKEKYSLINFF
jgi:hypothetical protein